MNTANRFGMRINKGQNTNDLSTIMLTVNQKLEQKFDEFDKKYLDKSEADQVLQTFRTESNKLYINEPITENIDMKNKKIIS